MKTIVFTDINYDAAVFLDGDLPDFSNVENLNKTQMIAADGAANRMIKSNFLPNLILGDLDSLTEIDARLQIIKDSDQDTNDFEKILIYLIKNNYKNVIILGLHGGILEHTLNNISVLVKYVKYFDSLVIFDKDRYGFFIDSSLRIKLKKEEVISIIPNPICNVKTSGLYWELDNELLEIGKREGARNKCKSDIIEIILNEGSYFLFIESRFPKSICFKVD